MSDVISEVPAAQGSPEPGAGEDRASTFSMHVRSSPPLSWLAAFAALAAMTLNQLLVPAMSESTRRVFLHQLDRWGAFATNLAAISGLIALAFGLLAFVRYSQVVTLRQRLLIGGFGVFVFLPTISVAVLFERQRTTAQIVLFALAASQVLSAIVSTSAARAAGNVYTRVIALLATGMATFALTAQVLQLVSQVHLKAWQIQAQQVVQSLGELCYLLLLAGITPLLLPQQRDVRSRVARLAGFFLLPIALGSMYLAERVLQNDYALLLYHAQRVTLFIDSWPRLYAIPIGLALAGSISALLASDQGAKQAAAGVLLLIGSGYAPHAPGRLLTSTLALVLIARAIIAPTQSEEKV